MKYSKVELVKTVRGFKLVLRDRERSNTILDAAQLKLEEHKLEKMLTFQN